MAKPKWKLRSITASIPCLLGVFTFSAVEAQQQTDQAEPLEGEVEEITVTGSRITRDEFSSPSPIQVLDVQSGRQLGISSITELLQRATVANGQQIDLTLNTNAGNSNATEAPPTGGVGSSNIDLRGLGPERTLILVNGRRLGSVGVRGAPAQPDINLIPFALVDRVEILTEGVSAVYGADAVAGVVNVILRDDFEGFEVTLNSEIPGDPGGDVKQVSMIAGAQGDRAGITFSAEYYDRDRVLVATGSSRAASATSRSRPRARSSRRATKPSSTTSFSHPVPRREPTRTATLPGSSIPRARRTSVFRTTATGCRCPIPPRWTRRTVT